MAGMALLEREIEKLNEDRRQEQDSATQAQQEHDRLISENYQKLLSNEDAPWSEPYAYNGAEDNAARKTYDFSGSRDALKSNHVPEYQNYQPGYHTPAVPSSVPGAPSAAQRIADYIPVKVGMQSLQRFGDMPAAPVRNVTDYAPVAAQPLYAPTYDSSYTPAVGTPERTRLFEGLTYQNGELIDARAPAAEPVYETAYAPAEETVPVYEREDEELSEEDALPTVRTLQSVGRMQEEQQERVGFFASLSVKAKIALAAVAAMVVLMIVMICVNAATLGSVQAEVLSRQEEVVRLTEQSDSIREELDYITDPDTIAEWAQSQNMTR